MQHLPIFVYGTLQKGEIRESCWPRAPILIETAIVLGTLHDLGPHPALIAGATRVRGELWHLEDRHVAETLQVLDQIEGYQQVGEPDWYRREVVRCVPEGGSERNAFVYRYARIEELSGTPIVRPGRDGVAWWRSRGAEVSHSAG